MRLGLRGGNGDKGLEVIERYRAAGSKSRAANLSAGAWIQLPVGHGPGQPLEVGRRRAVLVEGRHPGASARSRRRVRSTPRPGRSGLRNSSPWAAQSSSAATTRCALARMRRALNAAAMPIGTKSSWLASVGMDPMLAGIASVRDSATRDAAVICTIMKPDESPGSSVRKAGRPCDRSGLTSRSTRRSAMACRVVSVMARKSSACATGCPWKLPPEITSPSAKTSGLSVDALSSTATVSSREADRVGDRAEHLGGAAQAVGVLHPRVVLPVRLADLAVAQERAHQRRGFALSPVGAGLVDPGIERRRRAPERLQAHRRRADRGAPEHPGIVHQQRQQRGLRLGAVDEGEPFLGREAERAQAGGRERRRGRRGARGAQHLAFAHQRQGDMARAAPGRRSRRRCPAPAPRGTTPALSMATSASTSSGRTPLVGPQQHVGAKQHERAHDGGGQRSAHAGRVAADQIGLKLVELVGGDADVGELAEAGVDPVDRLA